MPAWAAAMAALASWSLRLGAMLVMANPREASRKTVRMAIVPRTATRVNPRSLRSRCRRVSMPSTHRDQVVAGDVCQGDTSGLLRRKYVGRRRARDRKVDSHAIDALGIGRGERNRQRGGRLAVGEVGEQATTVRVDDAEDQTCLLYTSDAAD